VNIQNNNISDPDESVNILIPLDITTNKFHQIRGNKERRLRVSGTQNAIFRMSRDPHPTNSLTLLKTCDSVRMAVEATRDDLAKKLPTGAMLYIKSDNLKIQQNGPSGPRA